MTCPRFGSGVQTCRRLGIEPARASFIQGRIRRGLRSISGVQVSFKPIKVDRRRSEKRQHYSFPNYQLHTPDGTPTLYTYLRLTMFRLLIVLAILSLSASAFPMPRFSETQCNTGPTHCCNNISSAGDPSNKSLVGLLSAWYDIDPETPIGLSCDPINADGIGSGANWYADIHR